LIDKKTTIQMHCGMIFFSLILLGPNIYNSLSYFAEPQETIKEGSDKGEITTGYVFRRSTQFIHINGESYECGQGYEKISKTCKQLPEGIWNSTVSIKYIDIPWSPQSTAKRFPISINKEGEESFHFIEDSKKFLDYKFKKDLYINILFLVAAQVFIFFIIKFINFFGRKI
jgi:hypothetical protein